MSQPQPISFGLEADVLAAAKTLMITTVIMWLLNFVALVKGVDPSKHTQADREAFGLEDEDDGLVESGPKPFNHWARIAGNQLEQWPLSLAIFWGAVLIDGSTARYLMYCIIAYLVLRLLFIVAYLLDLSPGRSIIWGLGQGVVTGIWITGLMGSYGSSMFNGDESRKAAKGLLLCTGIMWFMNTQALTKGSEASAHSPADQKALGLKVDDNPPFNYWGRIAANQSEQFPLSLFVYWSALYVGANCYYVLWALATYLVLRMIFNVAYVNDWSPHRSFIFLLSQFTTVSVGLVGICAAFGVQVGSTTAQGSVFDSLQSSAAKTLVVCTFLMWVMTFVALLKGMDPKTKSEADKKALGIVVEENPPFNYWGRIAGNQVEQFPMSLAVYWGALLLNGNATYIMSAIIVYLILRVIYIPAYLNDISPGRTAIFFLSQLTTLSVGIVGIIGAFQMRMVVP